MTKEKLTACGECRHYRRFEYVHNPRIPRLPEKFIPHTHQCLAKREPYFSPLLGLRMERVVVRDIKRVNHGRCRQFERKPAPPSFWTKLIRRSLLG